ncbi:hypothetical protein ACLX1H_000583 [Fusarium chlamydosporum]
MVGSKTFHLRLLELLAVSCHQIARWVDEPRDMSKWESYRDPTPFCHMAYTDVDQYPNGAADTAGYWAEAKIFGGVLVFDRGETELECKELYLHAGRRAGPYTLFPPTTEQFQKLTNFLLEDRTSPDEPDCPLPLRATSENRWRWSAWDAIAQYHIFRDKYERRFSPTKPRPNWRSSTDWPEIADDLFLVNAMHEHREGKIVDKEKIRAALENLKKVTPSSPCWGEGRHQWTNTLFEEVDEFNTGDRT